MLANPLKYLKHFFVFSRNFTLFWKILFALNIFFPVNCAQKKYLSKIMSFPSFAITPSLLNTFSLKGRKAIIFSLHGPWMEFWIAKQFYDEFMFTFTTFSRFLQRSFLLSGQINNFPRHEMPNHFSPEIATWVINTSRISTLKCALRDFSSQAFFIYCCEIELFMNGTCRPKKKFFVKIPINSDLTSSTFLTRSLSVNKGIHWSMQIPSYRTSNIALPLGWTANQCRHSRSKWDIKFVFNLISKVISASMRFYFS